MNQQQPTAESLDLATAPFRQVVLSSVKYHLLHDGPDKTKEEFDRQAGFYGNSDGWPKLKREVDNIILQYRLAHSQSAPADTELPLENDILKKFHNGRPIDFKALQTTIYNNFICQLKHHYDWLALWRILYDLGLLEDTHFESFAKQMNKWFKGLLKPCSSDCMGDYANPYLGNTPHRQWTEAAFRLQQTKKQSVSGYRRLNNLCTTLTTALRKFAP
ncbi:MAG: hypothetical protein IJ618_05460 [Prevotella sp.]|nr:hypothetical protein [Prevotella sp.]